LLVASFDNTLSLQSSVVQKKYSAIHFSEMKNDTIYKLCFLELLQFRL